MILIKGYIIPKERSVYVNTIFSGGMEMEKVNFSAKVIEKMKIKSQTKRESFIFTPNS